MLSGIHMIHKLSQYYSRFSNKILKCHISYWEKNTQKNHFIVRKNVFTLFQWIKVRDKNRRSPNSVSKLWGLCFLMHMLVLLWIDWIANSIHWKFLFVDSIFYRKHGTGICFGILISVFKITMIRSMHKWIFTYWWQWLWCRHYPTINLVS